MLKFRDRVEKATGTRGAGIRGIRCRESILGAGYLESSWGWRLEQQGGEGGVRRRMLKSQRGREAGRDKSQVGSWRQRLVVYTVKKPKEDSRSLCKAGRGGKLGAGAMTRKMGSSE